MNFGIIADGNRRWAKANNKPISEGHFQGFLKLKDLILPTIQADGQFDSVTIYGFSTENWKRSPLEVLDLMKVFNKIFTQWSGELIYEKIRLIHVGRKDRLPKNLLNKIQDLEGKSSKFKEFTIYLCLDYGGQDEIVRVFNQLKIKKITSKDFEKHLEVPPLDIVFRTGGENRLSNFCIWQAAYAEFFFIKKKLPEIEKSDISVILDKFRERDRRKGE